MTSTPPSSELTGSTKYAFPPSKSHQTKSAALVPGNARSRDAHGAYLTPPLTPQGHGPYTSFADFKRSADADDFAATAGNSGSRHPDPDSEVVNKVVEQIKRLYSGHQAEKRSFVVNEDQFVELQTEIKRDQDLDKFVQSRLRYDYNPRLCSLEIRMSPPGPVHDEVEHFLRESIDGYIKEAERKSEGKPPQIWNCARKIRSLRNHGMKQYKLIDPDFKPDRPKKDSAHGFPNTPSLPIQTTSMTQTVTHTSGPEAVTETGDSQDESDPGESQVEPIPGEAQIVTEAGEASFGSSTCASSQQIASHRDKELLKATYCPDSVWGYESDSTKLLHYPVVLEVSDTESVRSLEKKVQNAFENYPIRTVLAIDVRTSSSSLDGYGLPLTKGMTYAYKWYRTRPKAASADGAVYTAGNPLVRELLDENLRPVEGDTVDLLFLQDFLPFFELKELQSHDGADKAILEYGAMGLSTKRLRAAIERGDERKLKEDKRAKQGQPLLDLAAEEYGDAIQAEIYQKQEDDAKRARRRKLNDQSEESGTTREDATAAKQLEL